MDPLQEEGREGLGVGRRGEAKSDGAGHEDGEGGENIWGAIPMSDMCGLATSGG